MEIILASSSPRRKELLKNITDKFTIVESEFNEESIEFNGNIPEYVITLARGKAQNSAQKVLNEKKYISIGENAIVIGCDTVVEIDENILGKPKSNEEAYVMLKKLSGRRHKVYSGIALVDLKSGAVRDGYECTEVEFSKLSHDEIVRYVNLGESLDKAGAYGIQGKASIFVKGIIGCYYNVVGLPLNKLYRMLLEMGVNLN